MTSSRLNRIVASNIRLFRTGLGLSQEELAERCGIHRTYIGSVERGERNVTLKTLQRIAEGLGVDPISLLDEGGE